MRLFFSGPRIMGIRPGISLGTEDFQKLSQRARKSANASAAISTFVYVIEGEAGKHKIGVSSDPVRRISELQTGSPYPLKFAFVGITPGNGLGIESAAHQLLDQYKTVGEWFRVPASIAIGSVIEASNRIGQPVQQVQPELVPQIIELGARSGGLPEYSRSSRILITAFKSLIGGVVGLFGVLFVWVIYLVATGITPN